MSAYETPTAAGANRLLKLGRYEVVRELGKGAMGIVYLAKDPLIGRLVALKTIRAAAHADDDEAKEFQQRFIREAQAAGILNHPSIVTVHDIGQDDATGTSFIAMEYVEGQNLKEVLQQGRALSFDQIGDIIAQVAEALDFAHAKGIVHRDVKPANIILIDGTRAKITDFGIAKIASGAANLTSTGQFLGTPNYMAPEQIKGAPVDGRTDIFALGICLYECLTRRKPFGGDSLTSISYKIVHEPFPSLQEINPQIPEAYEELVANCLAKDPAKRYQRARDLSNALRAVIRGERPTRPPDPVLADETVLTRERSAAAAATTDRQPTVEVPFPAAAAAAPAAADVGSSTRPHGKVSGAQPAAPATPVAPSAKTVATPMPAAAKSAAAAPAPKTVAVPLPRQVRNTLSNVRALPAWRRPVPAAVFVGVIALLVAGLIAAVALIRAKQPDVPRVDVAAERRHARERQLRQEGNALLRDGRFPEATVKYEELRRLAPRSPHVAVVLQKLNALRQQEELSRQQIAQAKQKFDEGKALFDQKNFAGAIERFQESFSINPNDVQTAEMLKLAQQEQQKAEAARLAARRTSQQPRVAQNTTTQAPVPNAPAAPVSQDPAQLTTVFVHPFTDGQIIVRAGGDIVANETLYVERPARFLRRASRTPRPISVTRTFPSKNADVQVWITVPASKIQEHHTVQAFRFEPGGAHKLTVRYDQGSGRFTYELN